MSTGGIIAVSGIVMAFALFFAVLMWGDLYARGREQH
jgi:hypothetical protein